ncbi:MAG: hypothetical protein EOR51_11750 [Mesorhizobium sp.]|nr:hypothetical protein [Mesorhizobium sp.]RWH94168.1 MAG: hypothetical protein EOQ88_27595 [Mesorhizobium sp.]RWK47848.1 MAG: hypothetical protein EOR48_31600 [Mesorhizobium sp.]RWK82797.1 MAG: hypothetical protein EOR51_11750 [Mesorhizobium sp.]RWL06604.1 MAG: hypothetical protein EOR55_09540 [Mesorhizobium sp.]
MIKAMTMSARIALMMHGRVLQYASPKATLCEPNAFRSRDIHWPAVGQLCTSNGSIQLDVAEKIELRTAHEVGLSAEEGPR